MLIAWILIIIVGGIYLLLIMTFTIGWLNMPVFQSERECATRVSLLVPFRNEEKNMGKLLDNVLKLEYDTDNLEVILIDDHSEDGAANIAEKYAAAHPYIRVVKNAGAGKKMAIDTGINASTGELIITTDADCSFGPRWLKAMAAFYEENSPEMIIGPVRITGDSFFDKMQELEFMSLMATGAGAAGSGQPFLCSAANLGFKKETYLNVREDLNSRHPSGDDIFLLMAIKKKNPSGIRFLQAQDAVVTSATMPGLKAFLEQRIRWASKAGQYTDGFAKLVSISVFLVCLLQISLFILTFFVTGFYKICLFIFLTKCIFDGLLLARASTLFGNS
ncbi:MAG: glycosyltransferase, partial [Bacteroidota bacterium]